MSNIKSFFLASGQFIGGFVGWLIVSISLIFAVSLAFDLDFITITPLVSFIVQLIGVGLTFLAFRRNRRWTGIGLICALSLYLVGFVLHSDCIPPGFPYPLSLFPCL